MYAGSNSQRSALASEYREPSMTINVGPWVAACAFLLLVAMTVRGEMVFNDDFQQFANGTALTATNYVPASGPLAARAEFVRESGTGTVTASSIQGSLRAFADVPKGGNHKYEGRFPLPLYDKRVDLTWNLWMQGTNSGTGGFAVNIRFSKNDNNVWYNPIIVLFDNGQVITVTNAPGASAWIPIGMWSQYAGTVTTNRLVLDYPARLFTYSINGVVLAHLPISSYFTNVLDAVRFQCFEMFPDSAGNRFAVDNIRAEALSQTRYVWTNSPAPSAPYANWNCAAHSIQEAVLTAVDGDTVLVTNGTYAIASQIVVEHAITVRSVNGPDATIVDGGFPARTTRCFEVSTSNAVVDGFTVTGGSASAGGGVVCLRGGRVVNSHIRGNRADSSGGGAACDGAGSMVSGCVITGNDATSNAGGGVNLEDGGSVVNCLIVSNAAMYGGGVFVQYTGSVVNCTISGNSAVRTGGGVIMRAGSVLRNTIVALNADNNGHPSDITQWDPSEIVNSCSPGLAGAGNVDANPQFMNAATGNYRLRYGSPGIDAGLDLTDHGIINDLDGVARPLDGDFDAVPAFDIGCFEYDPQTADTDGDRIPDGWEHDHLLNPADSADAQSHGDSDGQNNLAEYLADTDPWEASSCLEFTGIRGLHGGIQVGWKGGVKARQYLQVIESLSATTGLWETVFTNMPPTSVATHRIDAGVTNRTRFYRIQAER